MEYFLLKWLHILSSVVLVGTGFGSAFYFFVTNRSKDIHAIAIITRWVVRADWYFTTPTIVIQPLTGVAMVLLLDYQWQEAWLWLTLLLYIIAGMCWLPVVWIQIKMRDMAAYAFHSGHDLPTSYWRLEKIWCALGVPAFLAMMLVYWLMISRPTSL
jgi:uncharacterized membrane protein